MILETMETRMSDGVVLRADVARPDYSDERPVPVLFARCPYLAGWRPLFRGIFGWDTESPGAMAQIILVQTGVPLQQAIDAGFAVVVQACRGTDRSDGVFRMMATETADGLTSRRALADQPWCDGRIVTFGASYLSVTQFVSALESTEHLAAITPWVAPSTFHDDLAMRGGVLMDGPAYEWARQRVREGRIRDGLDDVSADYLPEEVGAFTRLLEDVGIDEAARRLAESHPAGSHVAGMCAHPLRDEYWENLEYDVVALASLDVPSLHVAGWYDLFLGGTLRNYQCMSRADAVVVRAPGHRLVIGPWTHINQSDHQPGRHFPGGGLDGGAIGQLHLDFWHAALGDDAAQSRLPDYPVRAYIMGADTWVDLPQWPPAAERTRWFLGAGTLDRSATYTPSAAGTSWTHDPHNPVPTCGGPILMGPPEFSGPLDQRSVEARDDVVSFDSDVISAPVTVLGPVIFRAWVSIDATDAHLHAILTDVAPDGTSTVVADGILRLSARNGTDRRDAMTPGEITQVEVDMWATGLHLPIGHRLCLNLAASNWPRYGISDPNGGQPVRLTVHHDADHPSHLELPEVALDELTKVLPATQAGQ